MNNGHSNLVLVSTEKLKSLTDRTRRMIAGLQRTMEDAQDNPNWHLRRCECGRAWTRSEECGLCVSEKEQS